MTSSYYMDLRDNYINFKYKIQTIVTSLTNCNINATDAKKILDDNYLIDSVLPDNNVLANSLTSLSEIISYLNDVICVEINNKIANLNVQINDALLKESEN